MLLIWHPYSAFQELSASFICTLGVDLANFTHMQDQMWHWRWRYHVLPSGESLWINE